MTTYSQPDLVHSDAERTEQTQVHPRTTLDDDQPDYELQRKRYGGVNWGAAFFGWLVVDAMLILLAALATAGVLAASAGGAFDTAALLGSEPGGLVVAATAAGMFLVAYFAGGYVAGRMSRFDGGKQGVAVWVTSLLLTGGFVGLGLLLDMPGRLEAQGMPQPDLPVEMTGLVVLGVAAVVVLGSLLAAVLGGKAGCRYHRKVDDAAYL